MPRPSSLPLHEILADQWGMVTSGQAEASGVTRMTLSRMAAAGELSKLRHGVYMSPQFPLSELDDLRAAWLALNPTRTRTERSNDEQPGIVCDESAAHVHGIGDLLPPEPQFIRAQRGRPQLSHAYGRSIKRAEWEWIDGLPVTTVRRTLEDLAACGRIDDDQARSAVDDAVAKGLIAPSEVAKSKALVRVAPHLAPPVNHHAVTHRLRNDAQKRRTDAGEALSQFARSMFLAKLMQVSTDWVLKGGTGMVCRFGPVRSTKHIDLFRQDDDNAPVTSAEVLISLMNGARVGVYEFRCALADVPSEHERDSARVAVTVLSAQRQATAFSIDVSTRLHLTREPDQILTTRTDEATLDGYPYRFMVRLYPLANQAADKLCAMYERHGAKASTRYRDLYDLALLTDRGDIDGDELVDALRVQQLRRQVTIPRPLTPPEPGWDTAYDRSMSKMREIEPPYATWEKAIGMVEQNLGPHLNRV